MMRRRLLAAVLWVIAWPKITLAVAGAILAACVLLTIARLNISTDQNKLFSSDVPFFRDYLEFDQKFPENEAIYVVVERSTRSGQPPAVARWTAIADEIAQRLRGLTDYVQSVDGHVPLDQLGQQAALFDTPASLRQSQSDIREFVPLLRLWGESPNFFTRLLGSTPMERFIGGLLTQPADTRQADFIAVLAQSWVQTLGSPVNQPATKPTIPNLATLDAADPSRLGYYYVRDESNPARRILLVRVYPKEDYTSLTAISQAVEAIRKAARDVSASYPEFQVGVTGRPALEADEMRTTDRDTSRAEAIAMTAVFIGIAVTLRSVWLALVAAVSLSVAIGWTFGWATLTLGELNLLSIVFLIALIGIGMDYLVQVLARFKQESARHARPSAIWLRVFRHVSAPINTACLGAAGAFLVAVFTDFRGAAHLGIIAGGGLLLCLVSAYTVLPAILTLFPAPPFARSLIEKRSRQPVGKVCEASRGGTSGSAKRRLALPVVWLLLLVAGVPFMLKTTFDPGLINLQAPDEESVRLVHKLQTWSAAVLTKDLAMLRRVRDAVETSTLVASTESILQAEDNARWLRAEENRLPSVNWSAPQPLSSSDLPRIGQKAGRLAEKYAANAAASTSLGQVAARLQTSPNPEGDAAAMSAWQTEFIKHLKTLVAPFDSPELDLATLPRELRGHFVADDGTFVLNIYPTADLWNRQHLADFVRDVELKVSSVPGAPAPTGIANNIHRSTASVERAFYQATAYAIVLILALVLLDLRSIRQTVLAVSVLALGLPMLVAVMGLAGVSWNFANFFGLPILIGAAHEYGVFMVHRYREARYHPGRPWRGWEVSDRALLLCAYITISAFAFLWALAHHRGLASLGFVMAAGTACVYLATVLAVRPILLWMLGRSGKIVTEETKSTSD